MNSMMHRKGPFSYKRLLRAYILTCEHRILVEEQVQPNRVKLY